MQTRALGFSASRLVLALSLALAGAGVWAQDTKAEDHTAHHPAGAASASKPTAAKPMAKPDAMDKATMEKMGQMDARMKAMKEMHQKFMAAKTPEERQALMPEHMKSMQETMTMMDSMRSGGMDHQGGMGKMGGAAKGAKMDKMHDDMMAKHQLMEKRMEMMESMVQMVLDRLQLPTRP